VEILLGKSDKKKKKKPGKGGGMPELEEKASVAAPVGGLKQLGTVAGVKAGALGAKPLPGISKVRSHSESFLSHNIEMQLSNSLSEPAGLGGLAPLSSGGLGKPLSSSVSGPLTVCFQSAQSLI
jgi:hypothetical protein